jgi:hypothetical protein
MDVALSRLLGSPQRLAPFLISSLIGLPKSPGEPTSGAPYSSIAGFIASKIVNERGEGMMLDIVLGIVGGVVGDGFSAFSARRASSALTYTAWSWRLLVP